MTKALYVVAKANRVRLDGMVYSKEVLKEIARKSPEEYTYDEETGELLMEVTYNVSPMYDELSH